MYKKTIDTYLGTLLDGSGINEIVAYAQLPYNHWKHFFGKIDLFDDFTLWWKKDSIEFTQMDLSHIILSSYSLHEDDMIQYKKLKYLHRDIEISLDITKIRDKLKGVLKTDKVVFALLEEKGKYKLGILIETEDEIICHSLFSTSYEGEDINMDSINEMEYLNDFTLKGSSFYKMIRMASQTGEIMNIKIDPQLGFNVSNVSPHGNTNIYSKSLDLVVKFKEPVKFDAFALSFLNKMAPLYLVSLDKMIKINLSEEKPMFVEFNVGEKSKCIFYLAPRVEEDDPKIYED